MAESVVNRHGNGRFSGFSAGVEPAASVDPITLKVLQQGGYPTDGLRSKHWREFTERDAQLFDFVCTTPHRKRRFRIGPESLPRRTGATLTPLRA